MATEIAFKLEIDDGEAVKSLETVDGAVEDIGDSAKKSQKGVKGLGQALKAAGSAAAVIALLASAFIAVKKALESSEEGQNKIAKFLAVTGSVVDNLITLLSDLSLKVIEVFENPQQAIKDFANLIKNNITNRFDGLLELIPQLSKAITQLFEGDFSGAAETAANAVAKVTLGVDDIVGKTKEAIAATQEFVKEIVKEAEVAGAIADKRALADLKERELIVARAEANRKIAENREKAADKENVSTEERIRLLTEAGAIAEEITRKEIEAARLRFEAIQEENKLSNSNKEALDAEQQAKAELINLETARLQQQKALTAELTTTRREAAAEEKAIEDQKLAEKKERDEEKIASDKKVAEGKAKAAQKEIDDAKIQADLDKQVAQSKIDLASQTAGAIASFSEEGSAIGKAAAVAATIIDTFRGAQSAFANTAGGIVIKSAAAAIAAGIGIANVKKILATKTPGNKSAGGASVPSVNTASVPAPDFEIEQTNQNQLADSISNQTNNQPVKAFVVGSDVTSQQQMDRVQLNNATL